MVIQIQFDLALLLSLFCQKDLLMQLLIQKYKMQMCTYLIEEITLFNIVNLKKIRYFKSV